MKNLLLSLQRAASLDENKPATPWIICFSAALFFFYEFIQMSMFDTISSDLMRDFSIAGTQLSNLSATYLWADVLFLFPAGILLDRYSTYKIILVSLVTCVLSTALFAMATTFWFAAVCHFFAGIGNSVCFLSCVKLASRWFPPQRMAFVIGLIATFAMTGGFIAHSPLNWLSGQVGWRWALQINAMIGLVILIVIALWVKERPSNPLKDYSRLKSTPEAIPLWISAQKALKNWQNWRCGLFVSFLNLPLMVLGGLWGSLYLQQVHGLSSGQASLVSSMQFVGSIVGFPLFGAISDQLGQRRNVMIVGAASSLLLMLAIVFAHDLTFTSALWLFFGLGVLTSSQVIGYPVISESNYKEMTGMATSIGSTLIMGGAGVAQVSFGFIMDFFWDQRMLGGVPWYSAANYQWALSMFPLCFFLALVLALKTKETYCRSLEEREFEVVHQGSSKI